MPARPSPVVVSLKPRDPNPRWHDARSWFGGQPRLGGQPWPRGRKSGQALPFAAQLDLAELAAAHPDSPLPKSGSLAFFLDEGAVVFVPDRADRTPTPTPANAVGCYEPEGDIFPQKPSPYTRFAFPFWPIAFTTLGVSGDMPDFDDDDSVEGLQEALSAAVAAAFEKREFFFTAKQAIVAAGETVMPFWWHGPLTYAEHLRIAQFHAGDVERARRPYLEKARSEVVRLTPKKRFSLFGTRPTPPDPALEKAQKELARAEAQDARYRRQLAGFDAFIAEADAFAAGRDPWTPMTPAEVEAFRALFKRGRTEFEDIARYRTPHSPEDIATSTMLAMMTGDETAFAALPVPYRDYINTRYRLTSSGWHQIFGLGVDIQGSAISENVDNHLLLQLMYDDMVAWRFGDMGAFQFWITPEALAARDWNAASLTFECH
ncbi:hypothetical protein sos41_32810 [Alphaproteobacteria bacterium SO-S41]|nr:hypothetical protein sos41_32810 [Alphaproteobacteria bacterium SO-S41]